MHACKLCVHIYLKLSVGSLLNYFKGNRGSSLFSLQDAHFNYFHLKRPLGLFSTNNYGHIEFLNIHFEVE